ncbi:MAG: glycosyltransferase family 2 protein [Spirochaetes bacterium]|nr:glycosyltransferase family 2 protein [Spirochaetota bacterium]
MKTPLVSICIPTYNRPEYLLKALRSCFAQTLQDFEIIITDNSPDDRSQKLVRSLSHRKIKYYRNSQNIGGLKNIERARRLARGTYIKYLMDDDLLRADCLEKMVAVMEQYPNVGVVMAPLGIIDDADRPVQPVFYLVKKMRVLYNYRDESGLIEKRIIMKDFLTSIYPCCVPTGVMFRASGFKRFGGIDLKAKFAIDVEICMRFALAYDFYYIHETLSQWRFNPTSDTVQLHNKGLDNDAFYVITEKYLNNEKTQAMFADKEWRAIQKASFLFASKRSLLTVLSGIRTANAATMINALKIIGKHDRSLLNKLKLPFIAFFEVVKGLTSWFPTKRRLPS